MDEQSREVQKLTFTDLLVFGRKLSTLEERRHHFDLLSTILLSLAAVLSALSAYQASRWYTAMNVSLSESSTSRAQAAVDDRQANRQMLADMILFTEWTEQFQKKDSLMMLAVSDRFSESLNCGWKNMKEALPDCCLRALPLSRGCIRMHCLIKAGCLHNKPMNNLRMLKKRPVQAMTLFFQW